ncbi:hypothetical protein HDV57DRAFT_355728 [Trichoderma longibrachiatum]
MSKGRRRRGKTSKSTVEALKRKASLKTLSDSTSTRIHQRISFMTPFFPLVAASIRPSCQAARAFHSLSTASHEAKATSTRPRPSQVGF